MPPGAVIGIRMNIVVSQNNRIGREQDFDEYSFEVDLDGQFELRDIWDSLCMMLCHKPVGLNASNPSCGFSGCTCVN